MGSRGYASVGYDTIFFERDDRSVVITLNRAKARNALNRQMLTELSAAIAAAESFSNCQTIVLKGSAEFFCTGMDFEEALAGFRQRTDPATDEVLNQQYMTLLGKISNSPSIVISVVDGIAMAGGLGLVAASDLVIAAEGARFSLSEALWGLLPAMVLPYLIRRVGFQTAYKMTLTSEALTAVSAAACHLVDEVTDNTERKLKQLQIRLNRLNRETISDIKRYCKQHLCPVTPEQERAAVKETTRLSRSERIRSDIQNYVDHQIFPWEKPVTP